MRSIFELCIPRQEVLNGELSEDIFAARLKDVITGEADPIYRDPDIFFENTYPTAGLKILILDKNKFPREKVCGDGLLTDSIECLKRCGIYKIVEENSNFINKICVYSSSELKLKYLGNI